MSSYLSLVFGMIGNIDCPKPAPNENNEPPSENNKMTIQVLLLLRQQNPVVETKEILTFRHPTLYKNLQEIVKQTQATDRPHRAFRQFKQFQLQLVNITSKLLLLQPAKITPKPLQRQSAIIMSKGTLFLLRLQIAIIC